MKKLKILNSGLTKTIIGGVIVGLILFLILGNNSIKDSDQVDKIEDEIKENYKIIKNIGDPQLNITLPDGRIISMSSNNEVLAKHVKNDVWKALTPNIPIEVQRKYKKIFVYTDAIVDDSEIPEELKSFMLYQNANAFIEEYQILFKK